MIFTYDLRYFIFSCFFCCTGVKSEAMKSTEMLWTAVENNDLTGILDALHSRADIKWRNGTGFSALHLAAACGHVEAMSVLLMAGADKEAVTDSDSTPLLLTIANGSAAAAAVLAVAGANMNAADSEGYTPIMKAVITGKTSTAALLRALSFAHAYDTKAIEITSTLPVKAYKPVDTKAIEITSTLPVKAYKPVDAKNTKKTASKSSKASQPVVSWQWVINTMVPLIFAGRSVHSWQM